MGRLTGEGMGGLHFHTLFGGGRPKVLADEGGGAKVVIDRYMATDEHVVKAAKVIAETFPVCVSCSKCKVYNMARPDADSYIIAASCRADYCQFADLQNPHTVAKERSIRTETPFVEDKEGSGPELSGDFA
jgi:hypothetical protein